MISELEPPAIIEFLESFLVTTGTKAAAIKEMMIKEIINSTSEKALK